MMRRFRFTFRIMGGTIDERENRISSAERTAGNVFSDLCGYLHLWRRCRRRKTFGLLLEPLRYMNNPDYNATIFRRDYTQVTSPGGLWDSSRKIYRYVKGSQPLKTPKLHWTFKRGASVNFAHLGCDEDCDDWQGSQLTMMGFDELTHFSEYQFFYMLSRNRTDSGVKPYVRATWQPGRRLLGC